MRKQLLSQTDLTFAKAFEGFEAVEKNAQQFREAEVSVHHMTQTKGTQCHRFRRMYHNWTECSMKDRVCFNCGKPGHLSLVSVRHLSSSLQLFKRKPCSQNKKSA